LPQAQKGSKTLECPHCKKENPDDCHFCSSCGSKILPPEKEPVAHTKTVQVQTLELAVGSTFARRYKILKELGRGGMGIVYKTEDTKLKRTVALKSLAPQLLGVDETKIRFVREAQAAAALNHPNICTVYEIDEAEGKSFIAMEYIEGRTLKEKVMMRPLSLGEALDITIQMTDGFQHAHDMGIIHRDIKSSNIMIQKNGQAKIMDFGLAKLAGSTMVTREGTTLGTISYMSPEQAQGKDVDNRSDIWSLGVVLYELVSGRLPFRGERDQAVIYSIINEEPLPVTSLRSGIPLELERIIHKCLEKDSIYRYQSASDLLADLKRMKRDLDKEKVPTLATTILAKPQKSEKSKVTKRIVWSASSVCAVVVLSLLAFNLFKPKRAPIQPLSELSLIPFTSGESLSVFPCWSPDGNWVAYASDETGNMDIWKKPVEGGEAIQITTSPNDDSQPAWSPDGRQIAYYSDMEGGGIFLIPSEGGTPYRLTSFGAHPAWSPDSETLAFDRSGDIYLVPVTEAEPKLVVSGTSSIPYTVWSADGEKIMYWNRTKGDLYVFSLKNGRSEPLNLVPSGQEITGLTLSPNGRVLVMSRGPFGGNKNLWKVDVNPISLKPTGNLVPVSVTTTEDIQCVFSPDGSKLAFMASQLERHLWAAPLDSRTGSITGQGKRLTFKSKLNYYPACSPDGQTLVWTSHVAGQGLICTLNLEEGEERKATREWGRKVREVGGSFSPDSEQICYSSTIRGSYELWRLPSLRSVAVRLTSTQNHVRDTLTAWSPKGETIAFYSNREGNWDVWSIQTDGQSQPKQLTRWESSELYPCWSPDGRQIAFMTDKEGNADIWVMDADGGNPQPYIVHSAEEGWSSWSPDGRWFYFISNRSGVFNVWLKSTRSGEVRQVTDYSGQYLGLPDSVLYTKFAVTPSYIIVPLESRKGNLFILENFKN
jgi:serine/threonine protein kinase